MTGPGEGFVQTGDASFQSGFFTRAHVGAGMQDEERDVQRRREVDLLHERLDRVGTVRTGWRSEIDEITGMAKDTRNLLQGHLLLVFGQDRRSERFAEPLHIVFDEQLYALAADGRPALESFPDPVAGRHVSAEFHIAELNLPQLR